MRPLVVLKSAVSLDGYTDDTSSLRLLLSSPEDFAAVDALRASVDAILVGAETVRRDNPSLKLRDEALSSARVAAGRSSHPAAMIVTRSCNFDPAARFFDSSESERIIVKVGGARSDFPQGVTVVELDEGPRLIERILESLFQRGVRSLLVEGGGTLLRQFLEAGVVDRVRIAIAPRLLKEQGAPRMIAAGLPLATELTLLAVHQLGQMTVLELAPKSAPQSGDLPRISEESK